MSEIIADYENFITRTFYTQIILNMKISRLTILYFHQFTVEWEHYNMQSDSSIHVVHVHVKVAAYSMHIKIPIYIKVQWNPLYWSTSIRGYFGPIKRRTGLSEVWLLRYRTFVFGKVDRLCG